MTNLIDIETFQATLPACEDYLLHGYINVCQDELRIRSERELQQAKDALAKCSKDQLLGVLLHLGIELPVENQRKPRERKNPAPYGFKQYCTSDGQYFYVPKFFNPNTREHCVGSQAVFLQGLAPNEKLQRFGTVQQLEVGAINLAQLAELGLVYKMQDNSCVVCTLDMVPTAVEIATVPDKPTAKKSKQRQPEVEVEA